MIDQLLVPWRGRERKGTEGKGREGKGIQTHQIPELDALRHTWLVTGQLLVCVGGSCNIGCCYGG